MHVVGVLYEALWEPVFTLSGGSHFNADQLSRCRLVARWEVVILFPSELFPLCACTVAHLSFLLLISLVKASDHGCINCVWLSELQRVSFS